MAVDPAFAALREEFDRRHRETTAAAFARGDDAVIATDIPPLDALLGGGLPRGIAAALEGPPTSGRSALAARLLAVATRTGLGALIGVDLFPPALAAAGVELERLLIVPAREPLATARAADIVLRARAFTIVVIPALQSGRGIGAATWTRLTGLAHRANALLLAIGDETPDELRCVASLRLETAIERVRWNGPSGHLGELAGYDVRAMVRKHKRAAPVGAASISCAPFEDRPVPVDLREAALQTATGSRHDRDAGGRRERFGVDVERAFDARRCGTRYVG